MKAPTACAQDLGLAGLALLAYLACGANASLIFMGKGHGKYSSFAKEQIIIPEVGVGAVHPICDPLVSEECFSSDEQQVQDELVVALEADGRTTGERFFTGGFFSCCVRGNERARNDHDHSTRLGRGEKCCQRVLLF